MALMQQGMAVDQAVPPTMASMLDPSTPAASAAPASRLPPGGHPDGFTGQVLVDGQAVQVTGGAANFDGQDYIVSDDGQYVVDLEQHLVGLIQKGIFIPVTPEIIDQLKQQGVLSDEQPAGVPPQA